jgi:mannose-6-phosphate isomerase-like protein (cupin superfamily)
MQSRQLPDQPDVTAPDGSDVRILCGLKGGSMAHFSLAPGATSKAVMHRTVEEIWYIVAGEGEMWRADSRQEIVIALRPGLSLTIPVGTSFQFRSTGLSSLEAVAITMPPWPGEAEAVLVKGIW